MRGLRLSCTAEEGDSIRFGTNGTRLEVRVNSPDAGVMFIYLSDVQAARLSAWLSDAVKELRLLPEEISDEEL
jgi:hypothetical protein